MPYAAIGCRRNANANGAPAHGFILTRAQQPAANSSSELRASATGPKPGHILLDPLLDLDLWLIAQQAAGFGQVGVGEGHVLGSRRAMVDPGFHARRLLDQLDQVRDADRP